MFFKNENGNNLLRILVKIVRIFDKIDGLKNWGVI
jgi:hypothetical protein